MPPKLAIGHTDSAGETVQRLLPNAKVIKTLNIVGNPHIIRPDFTREATNGSAIFVFQRA